MAVFQAEGRRVVNESRCGAEVRRETGPLAPGVDGSSGALMVAVDNNDKKW